MLGYFCSRSKYTVSLFSLANDTQQLELFYSYANKVNLPIKWFDYAVINKPRSIRNYLHSILMNLPLSIYRNYDTSVKDKINKLIGENTYDLIICNYLIMTLYIPYASYQKTVLIDHNAEFVIWKRFALIEKNILLKAAIKIEAFRMRRFETKICGKFMLAMATGEDIKQLKPYAPGAEFFEIHHLGNDDLLCEPPVKNNHGHNLLFIGTMTWEANRNAMQWFVKYVYPKIKEKLPDVSLTIAGKYDKPFLSRVIDSSIQILGFVPSLEDVYNNAQVFICPLRFGSGTKLKVLDAMYKGLPVVTTSIGAENINLIDGENSFIADDADYFSDKVVRLLGDSVLWEKFSRNSRDLASMQYRRENEYERLDSIINHAVLQHSF
jgi:glycosyltransferase involved in cell wall biosynthesis